jgi:hypothetical protein
LFCVRISARVWLHTLHLTGSYLIVLGSVLVYKFKNWFIIRFDSLFTVSRTWVFSRKSGSSTVNLLLRRDFTTVVPVWFQFGLVDSRV